MVKYQIEVNDELNALLEQNARRADVSIERFIQEILNRYVFSPHILESEEVKSAYAECGSVNLEWANLK
ncbi:MAG: hypothetical protein LBP26_00485 [Clostridiales bacterium]|jgi:hypothetical protein|nr:hypothetical protein [Clostridiales bacterium]